MNKKFHNLLKQYSVLFLISILIVLILNKISVPTFILILTCAFEIILILFSTYLLISKNRKETFILILLIISIIINVLNFTNLINLFN